LSVITAESFEKLTAQTVKVLAQNIFSWKNRSKTCG